MNIYQHNKYVTCILIYKHNSGILPNIFNDMFMKHPHTIKRKHIAYKIRHYKTKTRQNTLVYTCPQRWNIIIMKNHIGDCTYMNIFKKTTKQYIWRIYNIVLTRNNAQLGNCGIFAYYSIYQHLCIAN